MPHRTVRSVIPGGRRCHTGRTAASYRTVGVIHRSPATTFCLLRSGHRGVHDVRRPSPTIHSHRRQHRRPRSTRPGRGHPPRPGPAPAPERVCLRPSQRAGRAALGGHCRGASAAATGGPEATTRPRREPHERRSAPRADHHGLSRLTRGGHGRRPLSSLLERGRAQGAPQRLARHTGRGDRRAPRDLPAPHRGRHAAHAHPAARDGPRRRRAAPRPSGRARDPGRARPDEAVAWPAPGPGRGPAQQSRARELDRVLLRRGPLPAGRAATAATGQHLRHPASVRGSCRRARRGAGDLPGGGRGGKILSGYGVRRQCGGVGARGPRARTGAAPTARGDRSARRPLDLVPDHGGSRRGRSTGQDPPARAGPGDHRVRRVGG